MSRGPNFTMGGLEPSTQRACVRTRKRRHSRWQKLFAAWTRRGWMAGSEAGHGEKEAAYCACVVRGLPFSVTKVAIALMGTVPRLMPSWILPASTKNVSPGL